MWRANKHRTIGGLNTGAGPMRLPTMVAVCCMLVGVAATSASAEDYSSDRSACSGLTERSKPTDRVAACTRLITSKQWSDQSLAILYYNLGAAHRAAGEYDRAIADLNEAIRIDPTGEHYYLSRGAAWFSKGDLDRAIADYNEAIRVDPKSSLAYYERGRAWRDKKDYDRPIADYSEAIRIDTKNA